MSSTKPKKSARTSRKAAKPKAASAEKPARKAAKTAPKIPEILLEGDAPAPAPTKQGPGTRYDLAVSADAGLTQEGVLPEAYGTGRLVVTARDPYWLYARWDLTREQLNHYNSLSADRHLVLRVYKDRLEGAPQSETHVHPESRNWFLNVGEAGATFLGELGYYSKAGKWTQVAKSEPTMTPPDTVSSDTSVWFETLPADLEFTRLVEVVRGAVSRHVPLMEAVQRLRQAGYQGLPDRASIGAAQWTEEQMRALAEIVNRDAQRRIWMGSLEITELIRRQFQEELSSLAVGQFSLPSSWSGGLSSETSLSSPYGGQPGGKRSFWFNVNAELILYGATEPGATVTIGGRKIQLRPDGTFSYRFSLPDGEFDLPAEATSEDEVETRAAGLKFTRSTAYCGDVGQHPQDPALKPPLASNVS